MYVCGREAGQFMGVGWDGGMGEEVGGCSPRVNYISVLCQCGSLLRDLSPCCRLAGCTYTHTHEHTNNKTEHYSLRVCAHQITLAKNSSHSLPSLYHNFLSVSFYLLHYTQACVCACAHAHPHQHSASRLWRIGLVLCTVRRGGGEEPPILSS